eukprot:TRINITY_DN8903_c0_g2_i3.p1 TRINITY_DN8903_c0_g2~~TRINITY_DN8903_c0_g2_i3.p1  ORF type:complete len:303 (+),score=67.58 TRINITY_DN8903_c0_g2_i3:63-971(+)
MAAGKAEELMQKGEKKKKKFFGGSSKYEDAREAFQEAAVQYKKIQDWQGACEAFKRSMEMSVKLKDDSELLSDLLEQANCTRRFDFKQSAELTQKALEMLEAQGKYLRCAKLAEEQAGLHREQCMDDTPTPGELKQVLKWWEKARDYWKLDRNGASHANSCKQRIAEVKLLLGEYDEAREIYEDLGDFCADDASLRFGARTHYFNALLCLLGTFEGTHRETALAKFTEAFERYQERDTQFTRLTQEHRFCTGVVEAYEAEDVKRYSEAQKTLEKVLPQDRVHTLLILRGKGVLRDADEDDLR